MSDKVFIFSSEHTDPSNDVSLMGDKAPLGSVDLAVLKSRLEDMRPALIGVVDSLKTSVKDKGLTEVTVAIGINAKGAVGFLGTGAEAGGSATLTLKFNV